MAGDNKANMHTQEDTLLVLNEWQELGDPERRDNMLDLFNETSAEIRLHMGADAVAVSDVVDSIPVISGGNYYIDFSISNRVYIKTEVAGNVGETVSFAEG